MRGHTYHGTAVRIGSDPALMEKAFERLAVVPDAIGTELQRVQRRQVEVFDFYDWDSGEFVVVARALYRRTA